MQPSFEKYRDSTCIVSPRNLQSSEEGTSATAWQVPRRSQNKRVETHVEERVKVNQIQKETHGAREEGVARCRGGIQAE